MNKKPAHSTTAADILGRRTATKWVTAAKIPVRWRKYYNKLLAMRASLLQESGALAREAAEETPHHGIHIGDAATDSFDRDFAFGMLSSKQEVLTEVEAALRRIETGSYGRCELTGKPIPSSRLEAIPWTRYTAKAQQDLEKEHQTNGTHLGAFHSLKELRDPPAKKGKQAQDKQAEADEDAEEV